MHRFIRAARISIACAGFGALLAGCSTGQVGTGPNVSAGAGGSNFALRFAVGTATIGTTLGTTVIGLNAVATFRQSNGQNATATNTPTLSGPASFAGLHSITGITPGQLANGAARVQSGLTYLPPADALLGAKMGVFGDGFDQLNLVDIATYDAAFAGRQGFGFDNCGPLLDGVGQTINGQAQGFTYTAMPLQISLPCAEAGQGIPGIAKQAYYAGPPAWPSPQGYGIATGFIGYPLGFTDFDDVAPVAGAYRLDVSYPVNATATAYAHVTAGARLATVTPLPKIATPIVTPQADGSALVNVNVPAGVTEAVVLVNDDSCQLNSNGLTTQRYFALLTRGTGPQTLLLSAKLGPPDASGKPTDTFCTAVDDALPNASSNHSYVVSAVGFDYPAFEASYPQSTTPTPVVANASGQADITTSAPANVDYALNDL